MMGAVKSHTPGRQWRSVSMSASHKQPSLLFKHRPALQLGHVLWDRSLFLPGAGFLQHSKSHDCGWQPVSARFCGLYFCTLFLLHCGTGDIMWDSFWHVGLTEHVENWSEKTDWLRKEVCAMKAGHLCPTRNPRAEILESSR